MRDYPYYDFETKDPLKDIIEPISIERIAMLAVNPQNRVPLTGVVDMSLFPDAYMFWCIMSKFEKMELADCPSELTDTLWASGFFPDTKWLPITTAIREQAARKAAARAGK